MTRTAYLGIDLGAESGRAMLGVLDDGRLSLHELHRFLHLPQRLPTGLHWNLQGLFSEILEGMRRAAAYVRDHAIELRSMGVDTWGVDCAYLGASGELLGLPFAYRDPRNTAAMEKVIAAVGRERIYEATGIQFMPFNTLFQVEAMHDAEPKLLAAADRLVFMPDLLHYLLTGRATVEATIASTSQMIDPRTGRWATPLLRELGLPTHMLGEIIPPGTTIGPLLPHVASETGLREDLRVIAPATHDTAAAVAAVPADGSTNWCYLSSGTWSLMGAELDAPCLTEAALAVPFTNEGGVGGTIRFLKNIAGLWLVQETRRHYEKQGRAYDYAELTRLAEHAEPFRTLVDTDHPPFMSPGEMPRKIADFARATGQPEPPEPGQVVRCCLESLALTYRRTLLRLEKVLGRRFDVLHIVGGGGRNDLLNQMTADATGRKVIVGPHEATVIGNVLTQAMGAGDIEDLAGLRRVVSASFDPVTYMPRNTAAWDEAFDRFVKLCQAR